MLHTSEQFASENVAHGATDRREQREIPAALTSTGVKKSINGMESLAWILILRQL